MGRIKLFLLVCFGSLAISSYSQTIRGVVLDKKTNNPIESASVYFDGTTTGTSTNSEGEFSIVLTKGVTSPLIISFLGYQRFILSNYNAKQSYKILLEEHLSTLDEVVILTSDGMSRETKLEYFRREFLGSSKNGKSCKILNESDLILRFNSSTNQLTASSKVPVLVENVELQYLVSFDIQDFFIDFNFMLKKYTIKSVSYTGNTFFTDLDSLNIKKIRKRRDRAYEGSALHFMKALSKKKITENDYRLFVHGQEISAYEYITVKPIEDTHYVEVYISKELNILYAGKVQSVIRVDTDSFIIDEYGNYAPIDKILFGGDMGDKRLGDTLPFDFQLMDGE